MDDPIADLIAWMNHQPPFSKSYLFLAISLALLISLETLTITDLYCDYPSTFPTYQLWRILTATLYVSSLSVTLAIRLFFIYKAIVAVERMFINRADFLVLLMYLLTWFTVAACLMDIYFYAEGITFALYVIYCRRRPHTDIDLVLSISVPAQYFPYMYAGLSVLLGESFLNYAIGFALGYLYNYLKIDFLLKTRWDLIPTPKILTRVMQIRIPPEHQQE